MSRSEIADTMEAYESAKAEVRRAIAAALDRRFDEAKLAPGTFRELVDGYYVKTVEGLVRDLRIFLGLNIVLYMMVAAASWLVGDSRIILASTGVLFVSNVIAGFLYLFDQNWLAAIILHNWTGYGY